MHQVRKPQLRLVIFLHVLLYPGHLFLYLLSWHVCKQAAPASTTEPPAMLPPLLSSGEKRWNSWTFILFFSYVFKTLWSNWPLIQSSFTLHKLANEYLMYDTLTTFDVSDIFFDITPTTADRKMLSFFSYKCLCKTNSYITLYISYVACTAWKFAHMVAPDLVIRFREIKNKFFRLNC